MLIEKVIKETLELQGFRIASFEKTTLGFLFKFVADRRYKPWCGVCGKRAIYRDTREEGFFRHVPLWGISVILSYAPRRVICSICGWIHVELLPYAILVFDKFHIIRHLMDAVDKLRREEITEKGKEHKELVVHTRYIWLKNPWNLTEK